MFKKNQVNEIYAFSVKNRYINCVAILASCHAEHHLIYHQLFLNI
jgi:hypothetical protein